MKINIKDHLSAVKINNIRQLTKLKITIADLRFNLQQIIPTFDNLIERNKTIGLIKSCKRKIKELEKIT
jgi:hypothetical protein